MLRYICDIAIAQDFGDAHECDSADNSERDMDFNNNQAGRNIGNNNGAEFSFIAEQICDALSNGNLFILSDPRNSNSNLISSNGCNCN